MTNKEKLAIMENRLSKLKESPKNVKSPGVVKALTRDINRLKGKIDE